MKLHNFLGNFFSSQSWEIMFRVWSEMYLLAVCILMLTSIFMEAFLVDYREEHYFSAVQWQKEATHENKISRKWAKCVCHVHWHQCNIGMSWLKYLSAGWVFLLQTWNTSRIYAKSNLKTSLSQIWVICQLLPFVSVWQFSSASFLVFISNSPSLYLSFLLLLRVR